MNVVRSISDNLHTETEAAQALLTGLRSDDEELCHDMVEGETGLLEAIDAALAEIDDCDVIIAGCKAREGDLAKRRSAAAARRENIRALIEQAMRVTGLPTARRATATVTLKDVPPKPIISDEAAIPAEYWKTPDPVLDKAKINKAAKDGESIPGVVMDNGGHSLQVRRA